MNKLKKKDIILIKYKNNIGITKNKFIIKDIKKKKNTIFFKTELNISRYKTYLYFSINNPFILNIKKLNN